MMELGSDLSRISLHIHCICEGLTRANPAHASGLRGSPSRYRLLTGATRHDHLGGGGKTFGSCGWRSMAGTLSPAAMSAPGLSPGQRYRLLLVALQLALADGRSP